MSNTSIEKMKKLIEDKKKKGSQQGTADTSQNKLNVSSNKVFKNTKRAGSLNK